MIVLSGSHGQLRFTASEFWGLPTECRHLTNSAPCAKACRTGTPMRVMIRIELTTYGESVISIPIFDNGEPTGPMLNGITYIVRPGRWTSLTHCSASSTQISRCSLHHSRYTGTMRKIGLSRLLLHLPLVGVWFESWSCKQMPWLRFFFSWLSSVLPGKIQDNKSNSVTSIISWSIHSISISNPYWPFTLPIYGIKSELWTNYGAEH